MFPAGFRERVAALFGGGLSLRDVVKIIEGEKWRCLNTNRILGWKPCRRVMLELGARAVIPASVQTFVKRRCTVGASKRETTAALYDAYALHCAERKGRPLTRDKFTAFLKQSVRGLRIENGAVSVAFGLTLKSGRPA